MASQTRTISLLWQDSEGNEKWETLYFDSADITTIAEADTLAGEYAALMSTMSGCIVVDAKIEWSLTVPAPGTADGGYFLNSGAYLSFEDSNEVASGVYVPGMLNANMIGKVVNAEATGVAAFITAASGGAGASAPLSTRGSGAQFASYRRGFLTQRQI